MSKQEQESLKLPAIEILENTLGEQPEAIRLAYEIAESKGVSTVREREESEVSEHQKDEYSDKHIEMYEPIAQAVAKLIAESEEPQNFIFESGMFGGKTSLVFLVFEHLEKEYDIKHLTCINTCMGEDFVTARSLNKKESAMYYGTEEQNQNILDKLQEENIRVLFLDECSFRFGDQLEKDRDFVEKCNKLGISVILTGLNKDYRGLPLPFFTASNQELLDKCTNYRCLSFVPGQDSEQPLGTHTTRYILLENKLILDLGVLPLVVSKEELRPNEDVITVYAATTEENTMANILGDYPLLDVLTDDPDILTIQERNKEILKNHL